MKIKQFLLVLITVSKEKDWCSTSTLRHNLMVWLTSVNEAPKGRRGAVGCTSV